MGAELGAELGWQVWGKGKRAQCAALLAVTSLVPVAGTAQAVTPHRESRAMPVSELLGWVLIATAPGLLHPLLGVAGAVLSAWRAPRWRPLFIGIAVAWLLLFLWFSPRWSGGTVFVDGGSPA